MLFSLTSSVGSEYYIQNSGNWKDELECSRLLTVSTSADFVYSPDVVLRKAAGMPLFWHIANIGCAVIALLCFSGGGREVAFDVACVDSLTRCNERGLLVSLPSGDCSNIDCIGLIENICSGGFNSLASLIAYCRLCEVDSAWVKQAQSWYF